MKKTSRTVERFRCADDGWYRRGDDLLLLAVRHGCCGSRPRRVRRADDAATAGVRRTQPGLAGVLVLSSLSTGSDVLGRRLRRPHCLATPPTADLGCGVRGGRDADGELVGELGDLLEPVEKDRLW
jgi:hypothetical protein